MADPASLEIEEDFYGLLNVPRNIGSSGLQTAYARLADDLALRMAVDPTARDQLIRINRAFGVLGNSDLRKDYRCRPLFPGDRRGREGGRDRTDQRPGCVERPCFAALLAIVGVQVAVVGYIGRSELGDMISSVVNHRHPRRHRLTPDSPQGPTRFGLLISIPRRA